MCVCVCDVSVQMFRRAAGLDVLASVYDAELYTYVIVCYAPCADYIRRGILCIIYGRVYEVTPRSTHTLAAACVVWLRAAAQSQRRVCINKHACAAHNNVPPRILRVYIAAALTPIAYTSLYSIYRTHVIHSLSVCSTVLARSVHNYTSSH